jgi:hypothetical protein
VQSGSPTAASRRGTALLCYAPPSIKQQKIAMAEPITPRRTDNVWQFKRVASGRPSDEIVAQIRARLASQVVRVGDKLPSERELEQQFQVSRNSIRQALKSLAIMGLLEMRTGVSGGAFVISGGERHGRPRSATCSTWGRYNRPT